MSLTTDRVDGPERTPDGHYVIINGRRWRATDPEIPDEAAGLLRRELMCARRAVGAALKTANPRRGKVCTSAGSAGESRSRRTRHAMVGTDAGAAAGPVDGTGALIIAGAIGRPLRARLSATSPAVQAVSDRRDTVVDNREHTHVSQA